ncbi:hypothetical protein [Accumulibacter sp.]|uniref:hypothetical protein n=1 Tax=Accumulibacter sp. TaxID=2053492 RepID=UPI0035B297F1
MTGFTKTTRFAGKSGGTLPRKSVCTGPALRQRRQPLRPRAQAAAAFPYWFPALDSADRARETLRSAHA